jgi:hypothetical protein
VSLGVVFALDYADQSFRTPSEVMAELRIPVLAAVPSQRTGTNGLHTNGNGHGNGNGHSNGNGQGNGNGKAHIAGDDAPFEVTSKPRTPNAQDRRY